MRLILFVIPILFLFSLVSAEIQNLKASQNEKVFVVCQNNGQRCSASATANITVFQPNGTTLASNQAMTKENTDTFYYNRTYNVLGVYHAAGFIQDGSNSAPFSFDFEVTQTGNNQTISQGINSFGYLILTVLLTFIFGFVGFKLTESDTLWVLGIFFIVLSIFFLAYNLYLGWEYRLNYTGADNNSSIPETIFTIFMIILTAGFMTGLFLVITKWEKLATKIKGSLKSKKEDGWDNNEFE